jgi:hypothetical protein
MLVYLQLCPHVRDNEFGYWRVETPCAGDFWHRWPLGGDTEGGRVWAPLLVEEWRRRGPEVSQTVGECRCRVPECWKATVGRRVETPCAEQFERHR